MHRCIYLRSGAWSADVLWHLKNGERCSWELRHDLTGISAKVLTARLRKLESEGIIDRIQKQTSPPTIWYALTPVGTELVKALTTIIEIAQRAKLSRLETLPAQEQQDGGRRA